MNRTSPIAIEHARKVGSIGLINSNDRQTETVHEILNILGKNKWNVAYALKVLDDAKDTLLYCTRVESNYLMKQHDVDATFTNEEPIASDQSHVS